MLGGDDRCPSHRDSHQPPRPSGGYSEIDGIHYVTFVALLDMTWGKPLTWAFLTLDPEARTITIDGVGEQPDLMLDY